MSDTKKHSDDNLLSCEVCLEEMPASGAKSEEVEDYIYYFCGPDCYKEWLEGKKDEA